MLAAGSRLGPYEIVSPLGAGGMGEVYKARDTRLERTVAIKILPSEVASDPDLRARFEREARAIAALDHPHICAIYDVGEAVVSHQPSVASPDSPVPSHPSTSLGASQPPATVRFLVMQHLEGETLGARLARTKGPLPLDQALKTATEIADALDKAHRAGITHRDVKPANIFLVRSGGASAPPVAKLLDFGLAKLRGPAAPISMSGMTRLATSTPNTAHGTILGTVHYMAPEQVEGHEADARSDLWALGAVIYEMTTGVRPFSGDSPASIIGSILKDTPPPVSSRQPLSPPALDHVVGRCLDKDPDERWQSAGDLRRELAWSADGGASDRATVAPVRRPASVAWIASTAVLLVALIAAAPAVIGHLREAAPRPKLVRLSINPPPGTTFNAANASVPSTHLALSPDGRRLAFVAATPGKQPTLWVQSLDEVTARAVAGTDDASYPFWSPDSRLIGYFARGKLFKVDPEGGAPQRICDLGTGRGGTWGRDNVILYASNSGGVFKVSASGGVPQVITTETEKGSRIAPRVPQLLPDGHHYLYLARPGASSEGAATYLADTGAAMPSRVVSSDWQARYDSHGFMLFVRDRWLFAQASTPDGHLSGDAVPIASNVGVATSYYTSFSTSDDGVLAFAEANLQVGRLTWFDRTGKELGTVGPRGDFVSFEATPDQKRLVYSLVDPQTNRPDLWLFDLLRGTSLRVTSHPGTDSSARWAPDGSRFAFRSDRLGNNDIYTKDAGGTGADEVFLVDRGTKIPSDWSPDGSLIVYHFASEKTGMDIWVVPTSGERKPRPFLQTPFNEMQGRLSPDQRWMAYTSDESGSLEVYVRPFPSGAEKWLVSNGGGLDPRWRHDGKELFYLGADRKLMAVGVKVGTTFESDLPKALFDAHVGSLNPDYRDQFIASGDGSRFLVNVVAQESLSSPITVVLNWTELLKK